MPGRPLLAPLHEVDETLEEDTTVTPLLVHNPGSGLVGRSRSQSGACPSTSCSQLSASLPLSPRGRSIGPSPLGPTFSKASAAAPFILNPCCSSNLSGSSSSFVSLQCGPDQFSEGSERRPKWVDHRALFVAWLLLSLVNFHLFASDQRLLVSYMGILATACGISVSLMSLQDGCTSRPSWGDTEPVIWGAVVRAVGFLAGAADLVVMLVLDVSLVGLLAQEVDCDLPDAHGVTCSDMLVSAVVDTLLLVAHGYIAVELARRAAQIRAAYNSCMAPAERDVCLV